MMRLMATISAGYVMVPMIFCCSRAWASVKSARRTSTTSRAPDDSPARIMLT